jgi:hypothetical protein
VLVPTNPISATYLETMRSRMRHAIPAHAAAESTIGKLTRASNDRK